MDAPENKQRDREIADNEQRERTAGAFRLSGFAIAVAIVAGLVLFGWMLLRR